MVWHSFSHAIDHSRGGWHTAPRQTVLVVQHEKAVRDRIRSTLEADGDVVIEARDALEALKTIFSLGRPVDLFLSDLIEPGLTGARGLLKRLPPTTSVLLLSLFPGEEVVLQDPGHAVDFLQSPFRPDALEKKVRELLDDRKNEEIASLRGPSPLSIVDAVTRRPKPTR
jgi:DNA-binding NtrC family response regulator